MSRTDLNKAAETILIPLLNEVYGWNLENINYAENDNNYPGIDLADEAAGISIQVTATPDLKKIKHTLEQFTKHNQYLKYKRLIIYILKEKQNSYSKTAIQGIVQNKFSFDSQKDIWDDRNILKEVSNFPIDRALRVQEILEAYFGEDQKPPSLFANRSEQKIDWQETCRGMLDRQIQFPTLNDLMAKDGVCIDPTLFVPVGLVERKQKQYRRSDVDSAEYGSQLLQPTEEEIVKRFDNEEDFFSQIICNSDISNHSRLVITGEPGAGKTTLLQKIGDRLCQAGMFPIWFSLGKSGVLPTYEFLSRVLKENAQPRNFESSNWEASISALLQTGKVWLLLDGADEFTTNGNPLHVIGAQLREAWANQVRIVLTCRLNAWDTYALPEFKVFRTLEFDYRTPVDGYSNQVEAYIYRFFAKDGVDPQLGNALIQQLHLPGKERIRDSVKNPLRLSLLCYIWESGIGELPDTRAELYRIFVEYYYDLQELKHPEISIDSTERDTLNLALGEVSKAALDSHDSRFRLRKSLIETIPTMGKESAKDSLFDKAVRLGWLNRIGTTAEKPCEAAYAFFHTTFQEYFVALAIDDWDYFLPREHKDKPIKDREYRIFELQWKEVACLWVEQNPNKSVDLINNLCVFDNNKSGKFIGYYHYTAKVLASIFIIHISCQTTEYMAIIYEVIELALGNFSYISSHIKEYISKEENQLFCTVFRSEFLKLIESYKKPEDLLTPIISLISLQPYEELNFSLLEKIEAVILRDFPQDEDWVRDRVGSIYLEYKPEHHKAISFKSRLWKALEKNERLQKIDFTNILLSATQAISKELEKANRNTKDCSKDELIQIVTHLSKEQDYNFDYMSGIKYLTKTVLLEEDRDVIKFLLDLVLAEEFKEHRSDIFMLSNNLFRIIEKYPSTVVFFLKNYLDGRRNIKEEISSQICYIYSELLFLCAQKMKYSDFYEVWDDLSSTDAELPTNTGEVKP